jgi:hypothetical protein
LSDAPPAADDERWAESLLLPGEVEIWRRMSAADRRHAVGVARTVDLDAGTELSAAAGVGRRAVLAAALLHDAGKVVSGLGTWARAVATVAGMVGLVHRDSRPGRVAPGRLQRFAEYLDHPRLGGDLLEAAGSDPLTVAWAREHHSPAARWTVPAPVGAVLKAADDD